MLTAAIALGLLGVLAAAGLGYAARIFHVEIDPKITEIEENLPGANCGGCGFAGCSGAAVAIAEGKAPANVCVAGGPGVWAKVAEVMGVAMELREREVAKVKCRGGESRAEKKFEYDGITDCRAAMLLYGGDKICDVGCLGLGTCQANCPFDAIHLGPDRVPVVDEEKCTGCGTCVRLCPKNVLRLESVSGKLVHMNTSWECLAPCQATCPAQIDIPAYISLIAAGQYEEAVKKIKERNPLPLTCGRVCPHPCEANCRRGLADEPVNINHLKRFAADFELHSGRHIVPPLAADSGKKVAIIGGGPAGLSAAYYLRRLGHGVSIFEAMPALGGMLRYGIPEYRLPKKILDWEIEGITGLGVDVKLNTRLGEDFSFDDLRAQGFDAIFIAVGAWKSRQMGVEGEDDLEGAASGAIFLTDRGLNKETPVGKKVVVIGGGNTAMDAARTSWRLGAEEVTLVYRRSRKEMPANDIEVHEAEREGVKFQFLAAPTKLIGENGKVKQLEYITMELGEPDASGRRRPVPKEGSETLLDVDNVFSAIGQFADVDFVPKEGPDSLKMSRWKTIEGNGQTLQTSAKDIFVGGDTFTGPATAVEAIGAGRRVARAINLLLTEQDVAPQPDEFKGKVVDRVSPDELKGLDPATRVIMPELDVQERVLNFKEVELGLTEDQAKFEARRCLNCGLFCFGSGLQTMPLRKIA
ncbi:MAG: RnfABCDGE type electron transport complex subunit B [Pseudomonadota bacterium]